MVYFLGIEIGGTKLQLGVGDSQTRELRELVRDTVDIELGAGGIVAKVEAIGRTLCERHDIARVGVGFGGPVDTHTGVITKSHQIQGWDGFPLGERLTKVFGRPTHIDNDCNAAALGEAKLGAGQGASRVFYVTVGSGIGGGFVVDGQLEGNQRPAISEIGHLRPGIDATAADATVESIASGWGIANAAREQIQRATENEDASDSGHFHAAKQMMELCHGNLGSLTTKQIGEAAATNCLAAEVIGSGTRHLGWAIAQVITLLAPQKVVVGGGVSLMGQTFFSSLRRSVDAYVFPPLAGTYSIAPAALGEEVVVHGAIQIAAATTNESGD